MRPNPSIISSSVTEDDASPGGGHLARASSVWSGSMWILKGLKSSNKDETLQIICSIHGKIMRFQVLKCIKVKKVTRGQEGPGQNVPGL